MIRELNGHIEVTSTSADLFMQDVIRLVKEGCEYQPMSCTLSMHGLGKSANFKRPVLKGAEVLAELPEEYTIKANIERSEEVSESIPTDSTSSDEKASESFLTASEGGLVNPPESIVMSPIALPDWTLVKSLRDNEDQKRSKDNLAEYASTFGVTLKKNVSFEKMMKAFEEAL